MLHYSNCRETSHPNCHAMRRPNCGLVRRHSEERSARCGLHRRNIRRVARWEERAVGCGLRRRSSRRAARSDIHREAQRDCLHAAAR